MATTADVPLSELVPIGLRPSETLTAGDVAREADDEDIIELPSLFPFFFFFVDEMSISIS